MTAEQHTFRLSLSDAELGWLAGAFGQTRLALPRPLHLPAQAELRQVQETLAGRGLIRRQPGTGWQVDRLVAFLVQWLGAGAASTRLEVLHREALQGHFGIHTRDGLWLLADAEVESFDFLFLPELAALLAELGERLGTAALPPGQGQYPLPEPVELVRTAWRDPEPARRYLKRIGLPERQASATLEWVGKLQLVGVFSSGPDRQVGAFASDGTALWIGGTKDGMVGASWSDFAGRLIGNL